jgi:hypothetical protein
MYSIENTPDSDVARVTVDRQILERGSQTFESAAMAAFSPLGSALFKARGVRKIEIAGKTIVVTKEAGSTWEGVLAELKKTLDWYFA